MDMGMLHLQHATSSSSTSASSSSSSSSEQNKRTPPPPPKKRPAGRTKFRETRHPVFRGVRRRGAAGRWVCEVRVPGKRGARLWLGTYLAAEAAARAHDAAMLALGRRGASCLNFPDSAWLLAVPPVPPPPSAALPGLDDARRAALEAVADFQRRFGAAGAGGGGGGGGSVVDEATSGVSSAPLSSSTTPPGVSSGSPPPPPAAPPVEHEQHVPAKAGETAPAALDGDVFQPDWFEDMDLDLYYASLAEGLLVEPPPPAAAWDHGDCCDAGADVALWSY